MNTTQVKTVDDYIAAFPPDVQKKLTELRGAIRKAAPDAQEVISYQMPAYKLQGILVYFAAFRTHIGFYPTGGGIDAFKAELGDRVTGKGTVRLALNRPLPLALVRKIVAFRVNENQERHEQKLKKAAAARARARRL